MIDTVLNVDGISKVRELPDACVHLILSDIPYGIGIDEWDVLHNNTNSAFLGTSPAQIKSGAIFKRRGKPVIGWSKADQNIPIEYQQWCQTFASEWLRVLKPGGSAIVFAGRRFQHRCAVAFEDAGFAVKDLLAWIKEHAPHRAQRLSAIFTRRGDSEAAIKWNGWRVGNLCPIFEPILWFVKPYSISDYLVGNIQKHSVGAYNQDAFLSYEKAPENILRSGFGRNEKGLHVAQKPIRLLRSLIELVTQEGQFVLDPFCGSGSTLVAAKETKRHYLGFEKNPSDVAVAERRLAEVSSVIDLMELLESLPQE